MSQQTNTTAQTIGQTIRNLLLEEVFHRDWLYAWLVETDYKHWEDEEDYIRTHGGVDALLRLAGMLGLSEEMKGAEGEGGRNLRAHMLDRQEHGPARLRQLNEQLESIESEVPLDDYKRDSVQRDKRDYSRLRKEKASIEDDLKIAERAIRHIDGEDIDRG